MAIHYPKGGRKRCWKGSIGPAWSWQVHYSNSIKTLKKNEKGLQEYKKAGLWVGVDILKLSLSSNHHLGLNLCI